MRDAAVDADSDALAQEHEALMQFVYMAPVGLVQAQMDGEIVLVNPLSAQLLMPLARDGELGNLFAALADVAPDLAHRVRSFESRHGVVCDAVLLQVRGSGVGGPRSSATAPAGTQVLSLTLLKLDAERLMAVLSDVTQAVQRERELRQSQVWIETLIAGITDYALMSLDHRGMLQGWNPGVERVTGHGSEIVGNRFTVFCGDPVWTAEMAQARLDEADRNGWSLDEGWCRRADGGRFWGSCLIAPLQEGDIAPADRCYSLIVRDISDCREAREALRKSVSCDHLTGLTNRRAFFDAAESELQRQTRTALPLSLVVIDADHFKNVNDRHGHAAGDAVLRHLATALRATFRELDVVARIGGEEFVVLLPATTQEGAEAVVRRLCEGVAGQTVQFDGQAIRYTVSAGVAAFEGSGDTLDALMKRADAALFAAKAAGRNRVEPWNAALARPLRVA